MIGSESEYRQFGLLMTGNTVTNASVRVASTIEYLRRGSNLFAAFRATALSDEQLCHLKTSELTKLLLSVGTPDSIGIICDELGKALMSDLIVEGLPPITERRIFECFNDETFELAVRERRLSIWITSDGTLFSECARKVIMMEKELVSPLLDCVVEGLGMPPPEVVSRYFEGASVNVSHYFKIFGGNCNEIYGMALRANDLATILRARSLMRAPYTDWEVAYDLAVACDFSVYKAFVSETEGLGCRVDDLVTVLENCSGREAIDWIVPRLRRSELIVDEVGNYDYAMAEQMAGRSVLSHLVGVILELTDNYVVEVLVREWPAVRDTLEHWQIVNGTQVSLTKFRDYSHRMRRSFMR